MRHPVLSHVSEHVWLWVAGSLVLGLALNWLGFATPGTLFVMLAGLLIIIRSQDTDLLTIVTTNPVVTDEDTKSVPTAPSRETAYR